MHDDDLFIDLKLNYMNDQDREIQNMFNKPPPELKKGREFETMPFFLADEFKTILDDRIKGTGGPLDGGFSSLGNTMEKTNASSSMA